jgi:lipopolysaccharide transport protein LptA
VDDRNHHLLGAISALLLGAALAAAGCADRARADPARAERPVATDLRIAVEPENGDRIELRASSAEFQPGFPDRVAGSFRDAAFAVTPAAAPRPPASAAKEGQGGDARDLDTFSVQARRMRYDSRGGRASFSGAVAVVLGELHMSCDSLEVTYHRAEGTVDFVAAGAVRVERPGLVATAGKAQYEGAAHALTLTESPHVEGDVGTLEGARIVLDVQEETVTVEEVRGTFRVQRP